MPTIPPWALAIIQALPEIAALIAQIFGATNGAPLTPEQSAQVAAYSAMLDGANQVVAYHAKA